MFFVAEVEKMIVFSAGEAGKRGQSFLQAGIKGECFSAVEV